MNVTRMKQCNRWIKKRSKVPCSARFFCFKVTVKLLRHGQIIFKGTELEDSTISLSVHIKTLRTEKLLHYSVWERRADADADDDEDDDDVTKGSRRGATAC